MAIDNKPERAGSGSEDDHLESESDAVSRAIDEISSAFALSPSEETMEVEVAKRLTGTVEIDRAILEWSDRHLANWLAKQG